MPRKQIRLPSEGYRGGNAFSVTIATYHRQKIFTDDEAATSAVRCLREAALGFNARIYAYCFMPDHVHLLAQTPPGIDFSRFVNYFKQVAGLALRDRLNTSDAMWQPRFYDHGLRSDEGLLAAAEYIFANPVRGGLVGEAMEYPHSGSMEWPHLFQGESRVEPAPVAAEAKATGLHSSHSLHGKG